MQRKPAKRSSLFLMELIIAILFFCLASAVCVRFFVKSRLIERETTELSRAANYASSVAEIVRSGNDVAICLKEQYPEGTLGQTGDYTIYFNEGWEPCDETDAQYLLVLNLQDMEDFLTGNILVSDLQGDEEIYHLEIKKYLQKEAEEK